MLRRWEEKLAVLLCKRKEFHLSHFHLSLPGIRQMAYERQQVDLTAVCLGHSHWDRRDGPDFPLVPGVSRPGEYQSDDTKA